MDWKFELVVVPVADVDKAKAFYAEKLGFRVDVDHQPNEHFRVVQLTPPGSACSITIGKGLQAGQPGSYKGMHLIVTDIEAAHTELVKNGVNVSEPFHFGAAGQTPGLHPERADYGTFLAFDDPDGNGWLVQEVKQHHPGR
jgi:catechol 2,3-dioxygenase-like lactoylglutathione lyase family enzyme